MFNKIKKTIVLIFCCFFQDTQADYTYEQLQNYFGKPVSSYQLMVDCIVIDGWLYTTELSKILLVGDKSFSDSIKVIIPGIGIMSDLIFKNRLSDTRFESFIDNVGKSSQQELQEAIQDAILLSSASTQSYSVFKLLDYLIATLKDKIIIIKDQIQHDFKYDQKSWCSMKKSVAVSAGLIAFITVTNKYRSCDDKNGEKTVSNVPFLNALATLCLLPAGYKVLKGCYKVLTKDPNAYNKYLDEFKQLLTFVQKLKMDLKTNGAVSFKVSHKYRATLKVQDTFFGPVETVSFALDN